MQRARGAYFVNKHGTFWKEGNFNFPEHQNFLKFIKKLLRKSKNFEKNENFVKSKCEKNEKKISRKSKKCEI